MYQTGGVFKTKYNVQCGCVRNKLKCVLHRCAMKVNPKTPTTTTFVKWFRENIIDTYEPILHS